MTPYYEAKAVRFAQQLLSPKPDSKMVESAKRKIIQQQAAALRPDPASAPKRRSLLAGWTPEQKAQRKKEQNAARRRRVRQYQEHGDDSPLLSTQELEALELVEISSDSDSDGPDKQTQKKKKSQAQVAQKNRDVTQISVTSVEESGSRMQNKLRSKRPKALTLVPRVDFTFFSKTTNGSTDEEQGNPK